jgi:GWxTD domain-containing protein
MPLTRRLFLLVLAVAGFTGRAPAQAAADRAALERFRDSLASIDAFDALRRLEADLIAAARADRDNALLHLRLGFVALDLGRLADPATARRHFDEAAGEFEWATQVQPDWPYGWYGLGLAELAVGDDEPLLVAGFQTMLGKDALTRSANAFARSAEVDPSFELGLVELSTTALRQRINARMDVALAALRRAGRTSAGQRPRVLLARARVERVAGSLDSSRAALQRAWARDSSQPVIRYEMARTGFLLGDTTAPAAWYAALATGDSTVTALAREDLQMILPDTTRLMFDAATPAARVALMRHFWDSRDDSALHTHGERIAEHFRRLDYARRAYRLVAEHRRFDIVERYRSGQVEYDDRGVIYIKHGEPDARAQYSAPGIEPNESWLYHRDDGDFILHFVARQDVQDFRLVESLMDVLGFATALSLQDSMSLRADARDSPLLRHTEGLLRSREPLSPIYTRMLGAGQSGHTQIQADERARGRRAIQWASTTDSWPLRFGDTLDMSAVVLAAGADSLGPRLQVAIAIPADQLTPRVTDRGATYPVRTRVTVQALDGSLLARLDTTQGLRTATRLGRTDVLLVRQVLAVPPGTATVRMAVETDQGGVVSPRDTVRLAAPHGPRLGLSDLVLGVRSVPLRWRTPTGDTVWISPQSGYTRAEPLQLYFEVSGLAAGTRYRIHLTVRKPGGGIFRKLFGGGSALELDFPAVHSGAIDRIAREVSLDELSPGSYRVEVRIQTDDDQEVTRYRTFEVR